MLCPECGEVTGPGPLDARRGAREGARGAGAVRRWCVAALRGVGRGLCLARRGGATAAGEA